MLYSTINRYFRLMRLVFLLFLLCSSEIASAQIAKPFETVTFDGYQIAVYDYNGLEPLLQTQSDTVFIIHFWATWCGPCVEEIPEIIKFNNAYINQKVKVILVSVDMRTKIKSALIPFLKKQDIEAKVIVISDPDMNRWIPLIDKKWEGTIPATLIFSKNQRQFYPHPFNFDELETEVKKFILP